MSISTKRIVLDMDKSGEMGQSIAVAVRQGDRNAETLEIGLENCGEPLGMVGRTARLMATLPDGSLAVAACTTLDASTGKVSCVLGPEFGAARGLCKNAYVEVREGATVVGSTERFAIDVLPGADMSAAQAAPYVSSLEVLETRAEGLADGLAATIASADITVSAARLDPGSEPTATVTGSGLAKHVELGIPSATAGVSCEAGPSEMVTVHGAAEDAPLVDVCVWGETRQNLWVNPASRTGSGVTFTANADGSFSLSGTATEDAFFGTYSYNIKPSKKYCFSIINQANGLAVYMEHVNAENDGYVAVAASGAVFTSKGDVDAVTMGVVVSAGATISGTYRVMLNEGDAPAPWSPPGLASVESVEALASGKNIYSGRYWNSANKYSTAMNLKTPILLNRTYTLSFNATPGYKFYVNENITKKYYNGMTDSNGVASIKFDVKNYIGSDQYEQGGLGLYLLKTDSSGIEPNFKNIQLEFGEGTSDYEEASLTTCHIPLPDAHPYLASLPDGTRDELRVHWDGTAELVARVGMETFDGSADEGWVRSENSNMADGCVAKTFTQVDAGISANSFKCDKLKTYRNVTGDLDTVNMPNYSLSIYSTEFAKWLYIRLGSGTTAESARTWLASNPTTLMYLLAAPVSYWYDGTAWSTTRPARGSLPTLRSAGDPTHVWAATDPVSVPAEVSAHVLLDGGKALGAEYDYVRRAVDALAAAQSASYE